MPTGVYERTKYFGFEKGQIPWNKGLKKRLNTGRTHFKKGHPKPKNAYTWGKGHNVNLGKKKKPHSLVTRLKMHKSAKKGKESNLWGGGTTLLNAQIRGCFEYCLWRFEVFKRDKFTCIWCGARGVILNADHIKAFSVIIKENNIRSLDEARSCGELWDISNGRTLCIPCHKKTENYGRR